MRARQPEVIEDRKTIASHIRQAVTAVVIVGAAEFLRQTHVAIVIQDDQRAAIDKGLREALAPADQLPGETLNKQYRDTPAGPRVS